MPVPKWLLARVYVGSWDGKLYALNADDGELSWSFATGGKVDSSPTVADGLVYVGSHNGKVYALNASTGMVGYDWELHNTVVWSFDTGDMVMFSSAAIADGDDLLWRLQRQNLRIKGPNRRLSVELPDGLRRGFIPNNLQRHIVLGSEDHNLYALNISNGKLIWKYTTKDQIVVSSPAIADGKVYIGSNDGKLYALDASSGGLLWKFGTTDILFLRRQS